jgi:glycosyltransferase involved in cell wall biosynthesis
LTDTRIPVTVVVPIKNEERNLSQCLARLSAFEDVWVVDSDSTDSSVEVATHYGARVLNFRWAGGFPKKRNWVLMNEAFATPWVLFLDADEHLTDAFVEELRDTLDRAGPEIAGYWLNYTNHFMDVELRHGVAQRKLALLRIGSGLYERIDDPGWSTLDMEVHEHPILDGEVGEIKTCIDHRDFRGIEHFIARHNGYSNWEASRLAQLGPPGSPAWSSLTPRQAFKYRNLPRWWFAPFYFFLNYVVKLGVLDGARGLDYAMLKMAYFQAIRLKILEQDAARNRPASTSSRTFEEAAD